jgi:hypothetical protein
VLLLRGGNVLTATAPEGCFFYGVAMSSLPQHPKGAILVYKKSY